MKNSVNPRDIFPSEYTTICYLKNVVKAANIFIGDYTYYDDADDPTAFEVNNILFNHPEFGDKLIIGKFCAIASGTKFIMGSANHRIDSVSTYPFHVFGGEWSENTPMHMSQLPYKGDTVVGNDVWIGRESIIMPGVTIGDGAIVGAYSVVTKDVLPYTIVGGNPAKLIRKRFDNALIEVLKELKWWDFDSEKLVEILPYLCDFDIEKVKGQFKNMLQKR